MRVLIREQLAALVLLTSLSSLAVISIATWYTNYNGIVGLRTTQLASTASLKAAQMSSNLDLMQRSVRSLSTRVRLQAALAAYNAGNRSTSLFTTPASDLMVALAGGEQEVLTIQAMLFSSMDNATTGVPSSLLNITGANTHIALPYARSNGTTVYLGDSDFGYPPNLYPNITYTSDGNGNSTASFAGAILVQSSSILLGPWQTNSSFALMSITLPVINNTSYSDLLGWMTVVLDARLVSTVLTSPVGLDNTGTVLLVTPNTVNNRFPGEFVDDTLPITYDTSTLEQTKLKFALPPYEHYTPIRHPNSAYGKSDPAFTFSSYPELAQVFAVDQDSINNAGGDISTRNEDGFKVSIGWAVPATTLCTWALVLEQAQSEVWMPLNHLRNILLACIFGTFGAILLFVIPIAHYSSRPIRRLRDATSKSLRQAPVTASPDMAEKEFDGSGSDPSHATKITYVDDAPEKNSFVAMTPWLKRPKEPAIVAGPMDTEALKNAYPIPETVTQRKHFITDELTDLTQYFNEMSEELVLHYGRLEERVRIRTAELEASKIAAEAANESKTLFIANISHELKTPLNGILGMCAVCMQETDPVRIKRSLEIIYKSGDLLHNLLTDLLTFSKNQAGQQLTLDETEFHLRDIGSQVMAIFENQAKEGQVSLSVTYVGPRDGLTHGGVVEKSYGPWGAGRVKDMFLWGDYQRILQVIINLVSNSLKFTPASGTVKLTIRCGDEVPLETPLSRRSSEHSSTKSSRRPRLRLLSRKTSETERTSSEGSQAPNVGAIEVTSRDYGTAITSDPPRTLTAGGENTYQFEFVVEDNGPGIAENLQQKIFEPFVQGDLRLTKKFGGTGLGLSICQQLSKLMHGTIGVESELGVGSKFKLTIPLKHVRTRADSTATSLADVPGTNPTLSRTNSIIGTPARTQSPDTTTTIHLTASNTAAVAAVAAIQNSPIKVPTNFEADSQPRLVGLSQPYFSASAAPMASPSSINPPQKGSKLKVLVAEDNKVNQEVVLRMLRLEEVFDVHVAKDGQEALDFVKASMEAQSPYDLIFMDVQMPNLDGRQSTRLIRSIGYSAPIVALTALSDETNQKECMDSGMDYFLAKPIRRPALKHVLQTYCQPIAEEETNEGRSPMGVGVGVGDVSGVTATTPSTAAVTAAAIVVEKEKEKKKKKQGEVRVKVEEKVEEEAKEGEGREEEEEEKGKLNRKVKAET